MTTATATGQVTDSGGFGARQLAGVSLTVWTLAFVAALGWSTPPWSGGLVTGISCAALSGVLSIAALALTEERKLNAVLLGRVTGFLGRILLLGAGLYITIALLHAEPMGFVLAFFPLFLLSTVLEQIVWTLRTHRAPAASTPAGGVAE